MEVQPVEGAMHRGVAARRAMRSWAEAVIGSCRLPERLSGGYSTLTRNRPLRRGRWGRRRNGCERRAGWGWSRDRDAVRAALDEGSDEVADHVVQESVGGDAVEEKSPSACHWEWVMVRMAEGVPVRLRCGWRDRDRWQRTAEVVGAEDVVAAQLRAASVERPGAGPDVRAQGLAGRCFRRFRFGGNG